jgi:predicted membrane chloride channel (bestrophin family)
MPNLLRSLWMIINYKTLIITVISVIATYTCKYFNFVGDLPITLIGTAIIFPVVFSINSAYKRREEAIMYYASFKANLISLFYAGKNWVDKDFETYRKNIKSSLQKTMNSVVELFLKPPSEHKQLESKIYESFDEISLFIQTLRRANISPGELSRIDQYLTKSVTDFEKMKQILYYRTPNSMRTYSVFFLYSFPILYAPYFAYHLKDGTYAIIGYISAVLYSFVFVSLVNIQEQLENPFDQIGEDDITFDEEELQIVLRSEFVEDVGSFKKAQGI